MVLVVEGKYPDSVAKVSLAVAVGKATKEHLLAEFGIGEQMAPNLLGWRGEYLKVVGQIDNTWGDPRDEDEKVWRLGTAGSVMRRGWGCDSFSILAEGWISDDPDFSRGKDLVDAYLEDKKGRVNECLSVVHVENEGDSVHICGLPFQVKSRKNLKWGTLLHSEGIETLRNNEYVDILIQALTDDLPDWPEPADWPAIHLALGMGLSDEAGVFLNWEFGLS
jgi:hypothetical protein